MIREYSSLACAIIEQAVDDYRDALVYLKKHKDDDMHKRSNEEKYIEQVQARIDCVSFLKSDWCKQLADIDGAKVIEIINAQVREGKTFKRIKSYSKTRAEG